MISVSLQSNLDKSLDFPFLFPFSEFAIYLSKMEIPTVNQLKTLFFNAVRDGNLQEVHALMQKGVDLDSKDDNDYTPLHYAAMVNNVSIADILLKNGVSIDSQAITKRTPLHIGAQFGSVEVVKLLTENGAKLDPKDQYGLSALHVAVEHGHESIIEILLKNGAKVNLRNRADNNTSLHMAILLDKTYIVKLLLQHGADIKAEFGRSCRTPINHVTESGSIEMIKTLLQYGARIDQPPGWNPMRMAIHHNRVDVVEMFLKTKPNLNQPCFEFLLFETVASGKVEITEMLIDYGLEINYHPTANGMPIHEALNYTIDLPIEMTLLLLRKGASLQGKTMEGHTPLEYALKKPNAGKYHYIKVVAYHQHESNI